MTTLYGKRTVSEVNRVSKRKKEEERKKKKRKKKKKGRSYTYKIASEHCRKLAWFRKKKKKKEGRGYTFKKKKQKKKKKKHDYVVWKANSVGSWQGK